MMKRLLAVLLVLAMAVGLVACGGATNGSKESVKPGEAVLAKVGDVEISLTEFEKGYAIVERNYIEQYGNDIFSQEYAGKTLGEMVKLEFMNNLILTVLKKDFVTVAGKTVPEEKIAEKYTEYYDAQLKDDPSLSEEDKTKRADLRKFFEEKGIDEAFIKSQIESQLYQELFVETLKEQSKEALTIDDATFNATVAKVSARHILVATQEEADAVIKRLEAGEAFEAVAKEKSTDTASGAQGGDLGFFMRGDMVPAFEEAAFSMAVGKVSAPVQTQFGFHVIKVDQIQTVADMIKAKAKQEELDAVKQHLVSVALETLYQKKVEEMLGAAKIERHEELLDTIVPATTTKPTK